MKLAILLVLILVAQGFQIKQKHKKVATIPPNNYPIRVAYIDRISSWYGDSIATALGVPGYAPPHDYNYIYLAFWSCAGSPKDIAMVWANAYTYFSQGNSFGNDTQTIQKNLRKRYNDAGIKVLVSAFGDSEFPTSAGEDPTACGYKLGNFVLDNNLDGADIDWEDNTAMNRGTGEEWLIQFTRALREVIPNHIVTHCPQAPYFKNEYYTNGTINGGYKTINDQVGDLINFYILQFYNQVDSRYDTYEELFVHATGSDFNGTAVSEVAARGVPLQKIVVGKPILTTDATNTGWVSQTDLGSFAAQAYRDYGWYAGIAHWQYPSDKTGQAIKDSAGPLIDLCNQNQNCV